jgi:hypothetical protein
MIPAMWLFIAEIGFFSVALLNIIHGVLYMVDPSNLSYFVIFAMFVVWYLDHYITYMFMALEITKEDLMRKD